MLYIDNSLTLQRIYDSIGTLWNFRYLNGSERTDLRSYNQDERSHSEAVMLEVRYKDKTNKVSWRGLYWVCWALSHTYQIRLSS